MAVSVLNSHPRGGAAARYLERTAVRFLEELGLSERTLDILVMGDAAIRRLNRRWMGKDRATDVLSFPAAPEPNVALEVPLGSIAISLDTALGRRMGRGDVTTELARYLAHGILHLTGLDHDTGDAASRMAAAEERLLSAPGLVRLGTWKPFDR